MSPEEEQQLTTYVRENLATGGMVASRIEDEPARLTAHFIRENRLSLSPFALAIAYRAIVWTREQKPS
jgi:hypothetical protein